MSHHASGPDFGFPHGDARLDMTDLYVFPKPGGPGKSTIIFNVHPSMAVNPLGPTTREPFAPGALYEIKVDINSDAIADVCYSVQFASSADSTQTATVRRVQGARAVGACDEGEVIVKEAPVSVGREASVANAGDYRFFFGWRSDPFFFDANGLFNQMQFTGDDFFADKDICSIVLELPNSALGTHEVGLWARTADKTKEGWMQADRGGRPLQAVFLPGEERQAYLNGQPADGRSHGNYKHDNASPFAPVRSRDCDPKGPTRRRWLEQSRSRESSSGVRDRFTMEEPLGVHRRAKRNYCFSLTQMGQGIGLPAHQGTVGVHGESHRRTVRLRVARRLGSLVSVLWQ
jgi:uncharacterized protein DUF4331